MTEVQMSNDLPFLSINAMLMVNKCWLCHQTFPRGLTKKAFQVQQLLIYFDKRYADEQRISAEGGDPIPEILTETLKDCYNCYLQCIQETGKKDRLIERIRDNDLDLWMSGLICNQTEFCRSDAELFLAPPQGTTSSAAKSDGRPSNTASTLSGITFANKDCPPGCGCDNPWAFLS